MLISFILAGEVKFSKELDITKEDLNSEKPNTKSHNNNTNLLNKKQKFKIPLNVKIFK